jgi:hypothetical protein
LLNKCARFANLAKRFCNPNRLLELNVRQGDRKLVSALSPEYWVTISDRLLNHLGDIPEDAPASYIPVIETPKAIDVEHQRRKTAHV